MRRAKLSTDQVNDASGALCLFYQGLEEASMTQETIALYVHAHLDGQMFGMVSDPLIQPSLQCAPYFFPKVGN